MSENVTYRSLDPLRLLIVTPRFHPYVGGVETVVYETGKRLATLGVDVTVLSADTSGALPPHDTLDGMRLLRVPAWPRNRDYLYAPAIQPLIRTGSWDVLHCQGVHTLVPVLAMSAARKAGLPYTLTFHSGGNTTLARTLLRGVQWRALKPWLARAQLLMGDSKYEAEYFRRALRLPPERFTVAQLGTIHGQASIALSAQSLIPGSSSPTGSRPVILSVGRLERYKGHHRVIAALPFILQHYPTAHLRIIGKGPYELKLRALVAKLNLESHVTIGSVPPGDDAGMANAYTSADVVTLLSEHEGQGLVVLDALAYHRPVVVLYATALRELADQQLARSVLPSASPQQVAQAIMSQLEQPLIPSHYQPPSWDDYADQLLTLYHQVAHWRTRH